MPTKEEALQLIKTIGQNRILTKIELENAFDSATNPITDITLTKKLTITEILYYLGGGIVSLGIIILVYQNWGTLDSVSKIVVTAGIAIATYFVGLILNKYKNTEAISSTAFLISGLVSPVGLWVVASQIGLKPETDAAQSSITALLLFINLFSYFFLRKNVFTIFSILFGTWFFFSFTNFLFANSFDSNNLIHFYQYRYLLTGIAYTILGYFFSKTERAALCEPLYSFGVVAFLGAAFSLALESVIWELVFPILTFAVLFLSFPVKSKAFLSWSTLSLMVYILWVTSKHFTGSLGWPISLVLAGFGIIGVGILSLSIKKKYI